jgi:hypothetical protein
VSASRRLLRGAWLAVLVLAAGACTGSDDELFEDIGVVRLLLVDPALEPQDARGSKETIQLAEWNVTVATTTSDDKTLDLAFDQKCVVTDTAILAAAAEGPCSGGIVVESSEEIRQARLALVTTMRVARGEPLDLLPDGDRDNDGVLNDGYPQGEDNPCASGQTVDCDDNCPLVANNGVCSLTRDRRCTADASCPSGEICDVQADENADGIGDACTVFVNSVGGVIGVPDSDGDLVPDGVDNCVWIPNTDQEPTDPVGDECEQTAQVLMDGSETIELRLGPTDLVTPLGLTTFVVADFDDAKTLSCDWDVGRCDLAADQVQLCTTVSPSIAVNGCP